MDIEVTINELFMYIGKLYVECEEAKKTVFIREQEIAELRQEILTKGEKNNDS